VRQGLWNMAVAASVVGRRGLTMVVVSVALLGTPAVSQALPLDFESVEDLFGTGVVVDNQFAGDGVVFANTIALTAGLSLNELDFPPRSGVTAVSDFGGAMRIDFTSAFYGVEAFFTYYVPITMQAFDPSGALLGQITSAFSSNLAPGGLGGDPGSSPNERLALQTSSAIAYLLIAGDPLGGSFVMDDFDAQSTPPTTSAPEPSTSLLLGGGLALAAAWRRRRATLAPR
jgi:hypothetical protein